MFVWYSMLQRVVIQQTLGQKGMLVKRAAFHTRAHTRTLANTFTHTHIHTHTHILFTHTRTHTNIQTHTHIHTYTHAHMHTYTHTHTRTFSHSNISTQEIDHHRPPRHYSVCERPPSFGFAACWRTISNSSDTLWRSFPAPFWPWLPLFFVLFPQVSPLRLWQCQRIEWCASQLGGLLTEFLMYRWSMGCLLLSHMHTVGVCNIVRTPKKFMGCSTQNKETKTNVVHALIDDCFDYLKQ